MRKERSAALFFAIATLVFATLAAARTSAQEVKEPTPPPPPPWVYEDGTVNLDSAPRKAPAIGSDGKLVREASGSEKMVPSYIGELPPPPMRGAEQIQP